MPDIAGNSLATATTLNLTATAQSFPDLVTPQNNDYYRFALTARSSLNLTLTGLDANANVELLDRAGNLVTLNGVPQRSANTGNFSEVINAALDPGLYYIRVAPGTDVPLANYTLTVAAQENLISTDLLWRYPGLTGTWTLDGTSFVSASVLSNDLPVGWNVGGIGDFNRDGKSDIIWRNDAAALTDIWFMDGTTLLSSASIFPARGAGWTIGGTGDFNQDGTTDIVWRFGAAAVTEVWFMDGTALLSSAAIGANSGGAGATAAWELGAIGDFNQDGDLDLLWQNRSTGVVGFWLLNGLEIEAVALLPSVPDPLWVIGGTGDYNQDGNLDILWRYYGPGGAVGGWFLNRTAFSGIFLLPSVPDTLWVVEAPYTTYGEPVPIDLAGNTQPTAFDLGKNLAGTATYRDRIGGVTDTDDFFQFSVATEGRVTISLADFNADLDLGLYDSTGTLIQASTQVGTTPEAIVAQLAAGTYFIQVNPFNPSEFTPYALSLSINTPPRLVANNPLTLSEQDTASLTNTLLRVTDDDNLATELRYTVGNLPLNGALLINGVTATAGVTFTQADVDQGNRIQYRHNGSETTSDRFTFSLTDGSGGAIGLTTFTINVTPVNDAPIVTTNTGLTLSEGAIATLTSSQLQATDPEGQTPITYTLNSLPTNGGLRLGTQTLSIGQTFTEADLANSQVSYAHNGSETTTDSFRFSVIDAAGAIAAPGTFSFTILPVNDAPVLTLPTTPQSIDQETNSLIAGVRVTDVDLGTGELTVTLAADNGVLSLGRTTGVTFLSGDGTEDELISFRSGQDVTNFVLQSLIYRSDANFQGNDLIRVTVNDGGNTGLGGPLSATGTITLNVAPINDPPILTVPGAQTVREDIATPILGISIADPDIGNSLVRVSLFAINGTLSLSSISGVTLNTGTGTADKNLVFTGTLGEVNRVLSGLLYQGDRDFNGADLLTISVSDSLNGANGIPLSDTETITITVTPVNDAPVLTVPAAQRVNENTNLNITGISVVDVDATGDLTVNVFASRGQLSLSSIAGLAFDLGDGVQDEALTFRGTQAAINNALRTLTYRPNADFNGNDTISINVSDGGNTGLGGVLGDAEAIAITVLGLNSAPLITVPTSSFAVDSDTPLVIRGIQVSDPDVGSGLLSVSLAAENGVLSLSNTTGLTFSRGDGSQDPRLAFSGTIAAVNTALSELTYRSYPGFTNRFDRITLSVNDNGNTGIGVNLSDTEVLLVNVGGAVNQLPIAVGDSFTILEEGTLNATSILVNDSDPDFTLPLTAVLVAGPTNALAFTLNPNGTFTYAPATNFSGSDSFTYRAVDVLGGASNIATVAINVTGVNDAPIAGDDSFVTPEDQSINASILTNDTDVDGPEPLVAQLIAAPANALSFTLNPNGTFSYTPQLNFSGSDRFTYRVVDGLGAASNTGTVLITITPVNDAPVAQNDGVFTVAAGGTLAITGAGVLSNDTDVDTPLANLTASLVTTTPNGSLTLNPNGSFTYQPAGNFAGVDSFTYVASDGSLTSNLATVTLSVAGNNAPIANLDSFTLGEDGTLTSGNVLTNDTDLENNLPLTATLATAPTNALAFTLNPDGTLSYTPSANFNGVDSFTYQAIDSLGAISAPTTVALTVTAVNDAPVAVNDTLSVSPGVILNVTAPGILANDTDIDSPTLTAVLVSTTANGNLTLNPNGSFTYRPNAGFQGTDSFTYQANDGSLNSANTATVAIVVTTAANSLPIAAPDVFTTPEDTSLTIGNVLTNDTDPDGNLPLTASLVVAPANALSFTLNPNGTFSYLPNLNFNGTDTFVYSAIDAVGGISGPATVTLSVTPVNDAPTAVNDAYTVTTTSSLNITAPGVLANDTDVDNPVLTASLVATAANGSLNLNPDGSFTYRPNAGFSGTDSFTYQANDGSLTSNLATVNISVSSVVNSAPVVVTDVFNAIEDTPLAIGNVLTNDTDPDGNLPLTASLVAAPANALSFTLNPDGTFNYVPRLNFNGADTFTYVAVDSLGARSQTATVTFNVAAVNDAPIASNDSYNITPAGTLNITIPGVLANDTDVDGNPLTASLVTGPTGASAFSLNPDGSFTYIPQAAFAGPDSFTYQVSDGTTVSNLATVSIVITANQFPTANSDTFTTQEDTLLTIGNVLTNDTDPDGNLPLTASLIAAPTNALSFTLNPDGTFSYLPRLNFNGTDTFTYAAIDRLGGTSTPTTVTFSVTPVNDLPTAVNDSVFINAGAPSTITAPGVLANDTDPDGNPLTASLLTNATSGTVALNGDGSFVYTPNAGFFGVDSFTYAANDGTGNSPPATVTVRVNGIPAAGNETYTAAIGSPLTVSPIQGVLANDNDPEGAVLTASVVTNPAQGNLTLNPDGSFIYTSNVGAVGTDSFTYRATDGLASATATVTIALRTNSAPIAVGDTYRLPTNGTLNVGAIDGVLQNDSDPDAGTTLSATLVSTTTQGALNLNPNGTFTYTPQVGFQGTDSFVYRASDGITVSAPATVTLSVSNNTPPVANNDTFTAFSGIPRVQTPPGVRGNDTDANGDNLTIFLVSNPANGSVSLSLDGSFIYTANASFQGADTFVYRAFDGVASSTATVTMSVTLNSPPIANPDTYGAIAGETLSVTAPGVLVNDSDPEGTLIAQGGGSPPTNGVLLVFNNDGSFVYVPNPGFTGVDRFTYRASDGVSDTLTTVTINVAANAAPTAVADNYSVNPNNVLTVPRAQGVLTNDTDPNVGQVLSASLVTNPLQGALSLNPDGSFTYTPNIGATGTDRFTYRATDGTFNSTATVTIAINTSSTPPTALNDGGFTVSTNGTLNVTAAGVLANDTDPDGDLIRASLSTNAGNGTVSLNPNGSFQYRPNAGFQGTDTFTYQAIDGLTASTPATVFVTVGGANAAPVVALPGNQLIQQNSTLTLASGLSVSDPDAGSSPIQLTLSATNGILTLGSLAGLSFTIGDGTADPTMTFTGTIASINSALTNLQFTPNAGYTGAAQITLVANDQGATGTGGAQTGSGTVNINVASGATLVSNINPGSNGSSPNGLVSFGNTVYFAATDPTGGTELWSSDGTGANTRRVADINVGTAGSSPANLIVVGNTLYYTAATPTTERELWRTDLTTGTGTTLVGDIRPGFDSSNPQSLTNYANTLFFVATDGVGGARQLWRVDAAGNPVKVSNTLTNVSNLAIAGNTLYFTSGNGAQLWRVDTPASTPVQVRDLGGTAAISNLTALGDRLFFTARDAAGVELWSSNGTAATTNRVTDLNPGSGNANPANLITFNGNLYFFAQDSTGGAFKLFQSTPAGVVSSIATLPATGAPPTQLTAVGGRLFFVVDTGTLASPSLQLWSSDGSSTASLVRDLNAGNDAISSLTNYNGALFFVANDGTGFKVFQSDGSAANTIAVSGAFTIPPTGLTVAGNRLLFTATDATNGSELWTVG
jgi:ELWxxDGT repeat protein/VCBS repeat-containing protein